MPKAPKAAPAPAISGSGTLSGTFSGTCSTTCSGTGCDSDPACLLAGQPTVVALVPAAGQGTRMGGGPNKPFIDLDGIPAIVRTMRTLSACPCIAGIVVMARAEETPAMTALLAPEFANHLIDLAAGGATRQQSVAIGLRLLARRIAIQSDAATPARLNTEAQPQSETAAQAWSDTATPAVTDPLVAIHDGARCLVSREVICRTLRHAAAIAPCAAAVPVKDTIKAADAAGHVEQTLDRSRLYAIQTPQVARLSTYLDAFQKADESGFIATDDLSVLEAAGVAVDLVTGDERNIKLTTPWDLMIARALLSAELPSDKPTTPPDLADPADIAG